MLIIRSSDPVSYAGKRRTPDLMGQVARWLEFIEDFSIARRTGTFYGNCDALSRRQLEEPEARELAETDP